MEKVNETLNEYVNDMLAVEREMHAVFRRQKRDERLGNFPVAERLVEEAEDAMDRHLAALGECAERLGGESALKKATGSVLGTIGGLWDRMRASDPVSRTLRDDYTALTFACACYEMLHTTGLAAGDGQVAHLALKHLKDYATLVMDMGDAIPEVVTRELAEEGKLTAMPPNVAEEARLNTCRTWEQAASHAAA